jgi:Cdc6-like AAA superfamily ATPase
VPKEEAAVKKSLYISGPPGTGKTTSLKHLLANLPAAVSNQLTCAFINCMALGSSAKVFAKVAECILPASKHSLIGNAAETKKLLEEEIVASKKRILVVLDEIDQLESKCQVPILFDCYNRI